MRYYKIIHGFDPEDYIPIDETELEKAIFAHLKGMKSAFSGGTINGDRIISIQPDYHRAMGWNVGYKLGAEDFEELSKKGIDRSHTHYLGEQKARVNYLIKTHQESLVGTNAELPVISPSGTPLSSEVNALADKFRV